jgi:hypothetical protein
MPIRQGGILASRASTGHATTFAALANIDADHGDRGIG